MQIRFANVNAHSFGCDCFFALFPPFFALLAHLLSGMVRKDEFNTRIVIATTIAITFICVRSSRLMLIFLFFRL